VNLLGPGNPIGSKLRTSFQTAVRLSGTRGLVEAALILERKIKQKLSQPGTGRIYPRGKKVHQASAPGEPPAVDTGRLRSSIGHDETQILGETISVRVGTNVDYATPLEYGSYKVKPRPFMRPALEEAKPEMSDAVTAELQHATRVEFR
jgi:HK97 gp10 family phage protein